MVRTKCSLLFRISFLSLAIVLALTSRSTVDASLFANQTRTSGFSNKVVRWSVRSNDAWLITTRTTFITNDAGQHWRELGADLGRVQCLHFVDSQNGWAVSESAALTRIWRTTDGGMKWKIISELPIADFSLARQIEFVDTVHGWMIGLSSVWRTTDGGFSWQKSLSRSTPGVTGAPAQGAFVSPSKAWISSENGEVYSTIDGGQTWHVQLVNPGVTFTDIFFANETVGWLKLPASPPFDGELYATTDGGRTWERQPRIKGDITLLAASFIDQYQGWAVGQSSIGSPETTGMSSAPIFLHTVDGGKAWEEFPIKTFESIFWDVKFVEVNRGWLVGDEYLYHTSDGGKSWSPVLKL